ncbi:MAG: glycosyltransferase family 2 protein, partial [Balneolales bacterium]|nr:glycosyltransferase family 2 protein [Balneolales bacterium]
MDSHLISFIIVNYKVGHLVHQAIQSIEKHVKTPYEIIVFDNNSDDGSVESLMGQYDHTRVIASDENLGFGAGNNQGFRHTKGDFIFLLNPDTILIDDSVDRMVQFMLEDENVGLVSPRLLYEDETLQRSIRRFYSFFGSLMDNRFMNPVIARFPQITEYLPGLVDHSKSQFVEWAKGAALLIRREVIDEIGLFDEDYWIYGEEMDLCYRIGQA